MKLSILVLICGLWGVTLFYTLSIWGIPLLLAVIIHELAHGWVALQRGDTTALSLGRLSFNPLKHVDLIGTVMVPLILLLSTSFVFGWAKPVPVIASRLHNPRHDMRLVALAGPIANLLMAVLWMLVYKLSLPDFGDPGTVQNWFLEMSRAGAFVNILLAVFNLVPIPPLDGGRVVLTWLPGATVRKIAPFEQLGMLFVVGLLLTGALGQILDPLMRWTQNLLIALVL
ncbi:MAG: site-2 protease family protein [Arenicella sp.]